jgi:hypothetical protein
MLKYGRTVRSLDAVSPGKGVAEKYSIDSCADVLAQFVDGKGDFRRPCHRGGPF